MARVAGEPQFGLFDATPVGVAISIAGAIYLFFASGKLANAPAPSEPVGVEQALKSPSARLDGQPGSSVVFAEHRPLKVWQALASVTIFVGAITAAAMGLTPIAAAVSRARCC